MNGGSLATLAPALLSQLAATSEYQSVTSGIAATLPSMAEIINMAQGHSQHQLLINASIEPLDDITLMTDVRGDQISPQQMATEAETDIASIIADNWLTMILPYTVIFLLTFVGNLMVIVTIGLNKRMRTVTNAFLFNLSLSDLLLGVFCMPFTLIGQLLRTWIFGSFLCRIVPFLQAVSVSVSSWTLVTMSYERYYAICYPLRSREVHQTWSHTKRVIGGVWLASFLVMSPIALLSDLKPVKEGTWKCRETWPSDLHLEVFTIFLDIILFVVPMLIMLTTYGRIVTTLWKAMPRQPNCPTTDDHPHQQRHNLKRQSTRRAVSRAECQKLSPKALETTPCFATTSNGTSPVIHLDTFSTSADGSPSLDPSMSECSFHEGPDSSPPSSAHRTNTSISFRCNQDDQRRRQQWRIIRMLFVVVLEFFICWTPLHVLNTMALYYPRFVYREIGPNWISIIQLVAFMSACTNPITYCFMNQNFRRSFSDLFKCTKQRSQGRIISGPVRGSSTYQNTRTTTAELV